MGPTLKAPGAKPLKLEHEKLLSHLAFNFNLRRYNAAHGAVAAAQSDITRMEVEMRGETGAITATRDAYDQRYGLTLVHFRLNVSALCSIVGCVQGF
jgi:hypothetical protein